MRSISVGLVIILLHGLAILLNLISRVYYLSHSSFAHSSIFHSHANNGRGVTKQWAFYDFIFFFWSRLPIFIFLLHFASIFCLGATLAMELSSFTPLFSFILFYFVASFTGGGCMVLVEVDYWRPGWIDTRSGKYYWGLKT
jgi:hypothetical protein